LAFKLFIKTQKQFRIVFHEITKQAILEALKNPRQLDENLFNAQQARRILDRIVGYKLSPFLWKKIARGLSAGRVQSAALRLICEKEAEIKNFKKDEYWTIEADFKKDENNKITAVLKKINDQTLKKLDLKSKKEVQKITDNLEKKDYKIIETFVHFVSFVVNMPFWM